MRSPAADPAPDRSPMVARVDPSDGATQVLRDAPVVLRISEPLDPQSLSPESVLVQDDGGTVPGWLKLSPDFYVVIWGAERHLRPGILHFVVARGLRDRRGRLVDPHWSRFVPCDLARDDLRQ
ncbi:MAG: Ig-like domain-containing protein [Vicinamibacteria bacterium]